jgi:hypothetical protein
LAFLSPRIVEVQLAKNKVAMITATVRMLKDKQIPSSPFGVVPDYVAPAADPLIGACNTQVRGPAIPPT